MNAEGARKGRALCNAMKSEFGDAVEFETPRGGYFLWCKFTGSLPDDALPGSKEEEQTVTFCLSCGGLKYSL